MPFAYFMIKYDIKEKCQMYFNRVFFNIRGTKMELNKNNTKKIIFIIAMTLLMLWAVINSETVFEFAQYLLWLINPLIVGVAVAFILNVCVRSIEKRLFKWLDRQHGKIWTKIRRPISILLSLGIVTGIFVIVVTMIVPEVRNAAEMLIDEFPDYWNNLQKLLDDVTEQLGVEAIILPSLEFNEELFEEAVNLFFKTDLSSNVFDKALDMTTSVLNVTVSVIGVVFNTIMGFVFAIYMLLRKESLARQAKQIIYAFFPKKVADEMLYIGRLSNNMFSRFITGQCTEAVIIGLLCLAGMSIMKMPYAPMISVLVGFTALIPVFGAFIGTAIGAFLILMISPVKAFWFVIFIIVLQQVEGNLIYPKVVGSSIGLPALWVMLAVLVGGSAGGILGMLISVPISAVLYCLIGRIAKSRLKEKNISVDSL